MRGGGGEEGEGDFFFTPRSGTRVQISLPLRHSMVMYGR